jgi:hypothetical protein
MYSSFEGFVMSDQAGRTAERFTFDLPAILREAVSLGQVIRSPETTSGGHLIEVARFRGVLNPLGLPYGWNSQYAFGRIHPTYRSPEYDQPYFGNAVEFGEGVPLRARPALTTLAAAAVLLNNPDPPAEAFVLLGSGVWLLWQEMDAELRAGCRTSIAAAVHLWRWLTDPSGEPGAHTGPKYEVRKHLTGTIELDEWRMIGGSLNDIQRHMATAYELRRQSVDRVAAHLPTPAPENTPPTLLRVYELVAGAVADALRFMTGLHQYRRSDGFAVAEYWRDVLPVCRAAEEAINAFDEAELELRAGGSPDAFIAAVTDLKRFLGHTQADDPARRPEDVHGRQLQVNRGTTLLEQFFALQPFGKNPFERMRNELARAANLRLSAPPAPPQEIPKWDREARTLRFRGALIRDYRRKRAPRQEAVLDAFQTSGWPRCIIPDVDQDKIEDTVRALNEKVAKDTILFLQDGTGEGVAWGLAMSGICPGDAPGG